MAQDVLPPPPINDKPGSFTWLEWYRKLRNYVSTSGSVPWYIINFAGSNITDIALRSHQNLQTIQGGTSGEAYHLTQTQHSDIINNIHCENIDYQVPVTGFSITASASDNVILLEPAGTLASGTVIMPASPKDKQVVRIATTATITALTVSANTGQTLKGAVTTLAANGFASWIYRSTNTTWYRIG